LENLLQSNVAAEIKHWLKTLADMLMVKKNIQSALMNPFVKKHLYCLQDYRIIDLRQTRTKFFHTQYALNVERDNRPSGSTKQPTQLSLKSRPNLGLNVIKKDGGQHARAGSFRRV
jgi:hypothetical protein